MYLNLILIDDFIGLSIYAKIFALVIAIFILITLINIMDEYKYIAKTAPIFIIIAISIVLIQTHRSYEFTPAASTNSETTSAENIRIVDFKSTPNVYFISFDSMIPKILLKKYLKIETTSYHDILDSKFRRFNNFFADQHNTVASFSSLLALDPDHYQDSLTNKTYKHFFSGFIPSPLFEIFKHNGYEATTSFINYNFGTKKGPYLDNYLVNKSSLKDGVCRFTPKNDLYAFTYMGYCSLLKFKLFRKIIRVLRLDSQSDLTHVDFLIKNLKSGLHKKVPQVFLGYIYSPGHTPQTFDISNDGAIEKYQKLLFKGKQRNFHSPNEDTDVYRPRRPKCNCLHIWRSWTMD